MSAYQLRTDLECLNCDHFEDESGGFAFGKCRPTGLVICRASGTHRAAVAADIVSAEVSTRQPAQPQPPRPSRR
jgi:hypothetical protein